MTKKLEKIIKTCRDCPHTKECPNDGYYFRCAHPNYEGSGSYSQWTTQRILNGCPLDAAADLGVKAGVAVILIREDGKILVGKRKNTSAGDGYWGLPGGRIDRWETPEETAKRETFEESDIVVYDLEYFDYTNDMFKEEDEHWITMYFISRNFEGEAKIMEPNKCEEWRWVDTDDLPEPIFCAWKEKLSKINSSK